MYRRVVVNATKSNSGLVSILYHVQNARLISQGLYYKGGFNSAIGADNMQRPVMFNDSIRLFINSYLDTGRFYEFILDVPENQPAEEVVEEISSAGVHITVYNDHGVIVCRNTPKTPSNGDPAQTDSPGEMI